MTLPPEWLIPAWDAPAPVKAFITTRQGGCSTGPYCSMNLGTRVNDDPLAVDSNRGRLQTYLPAPPCWLKQVHGTQVVDASRAALDEEADAAYTHKAGIVCAIMMADCMPVLLCDDDATVVAAAHAGWRGLASGVIEQTVSALGVKPAHLRAYLGPAIGPRFFEVGDDVFAAFMAHSALARVAFHALGRGKWLCDLFMLARQRLDALGIQRVSGGDLCTYSDPARFFSHRRDRVSGRMAALIWLEDRQS